MTAARLLALAVTCVLPAAAHAVEVPVQFSHDDGKATGTLQIEQKPLPVGTILAASFRAEHLLAVDAIEVAGWGGPGKLEVHVWRDNGGNQPGGPEGYFTAAEDADILPAKTVQVQEKGAWIQLDLAQDELMVAPLDLFWVGVRVVQPGVALAIDAIEKDKKPLTALVQTPTGVCKDGCGVPADLLVRVKGRYLEPLGDERWFRDVTVAAGVQPGGRMAFGDYDNDGDEDVLVGGNGLYRNDGQGTFTDVRQQAKLAGFGGAGGLWGDYDNDGHLDIFVFGGKERLLRNLGDGTFAEVTSADFTESKERDFPSEAAVWLDVDRDGWLDLYVANYETVTKTAAGDDVLGVCDVDLLWRNRGDGTFEDVSEAYGVHAPAKQCGRGLATADWDQDGDIDLFVSNYRLDPDFFFRNELPQPFLTEIGKQNKTAGTQIQGAWGHGTGPQFVDADNDGDFDLFVANLAHPRFIAFSNRSLFFQNLGKAGGFAFTEHRQETGIAYRETHSNPTFADFDNDGDLDVSITAVYEDRAGQLWRNDGPGGGLWLRYTDVTYPGGWIVYGGWGSAWADVDGDGQLDQMTNKQLFRNAYAESSGASGHWLKLKLRGSQKVNRAAIGAWATVELGDGRVLTRSVSGGQGLGCQDAQTLHFGLGAATEVQKITVHFPGLPAEVHGPFAADQTVVVTEGKGAEGLPPGRPQADAGSDVAGTDAPAPDAMADAGPDGGAEKAPTGDADGGCTAGRTGPLPGAAAGLLLAAGLAWVRRRRAGG